jgi:hypothetical protein
LTSAGRVDSGNRDNLHRLIDTLPEGALETAKRMLEHLNNPPQLSPEMERCDRYGREQMEKMRQSIRPGTVGDGGGGGSFNLTTRYGHSGRTHWEDQTAVHETHGFSKGHEIAVTERIRFTEDSRAIHYVHEAKGPKGEPVVNEIKFDVE